MLTINNFLFKAQIDNINLFKVVIMLLKNTVMASKHPIQTANSDSVNATLTLVTEIL